MAAGRDGNLWFTESGANKIGRITPAGAVTEFAVPTGNSQPEGITAGPDGSIWFTESNASKIGRFFLPSYFGVAAFINSVPAGVASSVTVTARDSSNTTATSYRGTVHFTSSDG